MLPFAGGPTYDALATLALALVAFTILGALLIQTPYGRFADTKWGLSLDPRLGWFLMELPASVSFVVTYLLGPRRLDPYPLVLLFVWCCHYLNRGFLMPLFMRVPRGAAGSFSFMVVAIGWVVTSLHGYLNARWATTFQAETGLAWLTEPRFVVGLGTYYVAMGFNLHADHVLRTLRTKEEIERGERVYRIPRGGLFEYVTNASYLSELVAWAGFALLTWSPGGLFILLISVANLVPRARATHRWYRERFSDYPERRKALIPFLW